MKFNRILKLCILFSMIFIINLTYVNKSIAKSIYDSDIIIEQLDLDNNYNDINNKIQFLNDVLNILHMKNDFKSFDEFIKYADDNDSFTNIVPYTMNGKDTYVYNTNSINSSNKIILIIQDNQLFVVHPNKNLKNDIICVSTVSQYYKYTKQNIKYDMIVNVDLKNIHIYEIDTLSYNSPLDSISYTCSFGYRSDPFTGEQKYHSGVDLKASMNSNVYAVENGKVEFAGNKDDGYGNYVIINHENGYSTLYAHCDKVLVNKGDSVSAGQLIAESGNTGRSTGPHLHFEYRHNGTAIDPSKYLKGGN